MSNKVDSLIVGAGPAGVSAACTLAELGMSVLLIDQFPDLGGAVHRRPTHTAAKLSIPADHQQSWQELLHRLEKQDKQITLSTGTQFVGRDATGAVVLKNQSTNIAHYVITDSIVLAVGSVENVLPISGWELPGVVTAGGLQLSMKSAGAPPPGEVVLAGNGPLLLAVAAQLIDMGKPPIAVIESGNPLRPQSSWFDIPPPYLREGASYLSKLLLNNVPWTRGATIKQIEKTQQAFRIQVQKGRQVLEYHADLVALHNGLVSNNYDLPGENLDPALGTVICHAGDCKEVLGARAACASGKLAAETIVAAIGKHATTSTPVELDIHRRAQSSLNRVFAPLYPPALDQLDDNTILCRCEGKTVGDLRQLVRQDALTGREVRLNGRFGMGRCRGRFCANAALSLLASYSGSQPQPQDELGGHARWPVKPISIRALAELTK